MGIDSFLASTETPMAAMDLAAAALTAVWKTIGLAWLPGYDEMFGTVGAGAQYPVKWFPTFFPIGALYLAMYGLLGGAAHYGSLKLSLDGDKQDPAVAKRRAQVLGFFHIVIGVHHVAWTFLPNWGRLDLSEYNISKWPLALSSVGTIYKGWELCNTDEVPLMRRRKALLDTISFVSLIPTFGFLPSNWLGYRSFGFEKALWLTVPYGTLGLLAWDFLETKKNDAPKED